MHETSSSSNLNTGDQFERAVAEALRATGYRVEHEQLINHQKVDLLASRSHWDGEWRVAVECKDYARPLSKKAVAAVWSEYATLYEARHVDEVLLVASHGFSPAAITFIKDRRGLIGQDIAALTRASIDLSAYLTTIASYFNEARDGLPHYYIPAVTTHGDDLEQLVLRWIAGESIGGPAIGQPIAILGSYGLGKSSFATHLASKLAGQALQDPRSRAPVLIRLSELAGEQSLEGLLGKHFTALHNVGSYSFAKFCQLNRRGRFVIILDGFDEMKKLLSWSDFKFNMGELNRLIEGDSRVIILGRPTAFENDEEQRWALHGEKQVAGEPVREPDWPDYYEVELAPLDPTGVREFLIKYLTYRKSPLAADPEEFARLWRHVASKQLRDIASRPVQLRMLAEILPEYQGDIAELSLDKVYDFFIALLIDGVITREEMKGSRFPFTAKQRRRFLSAFALWLWQRRGPTVVTTDQVSDSLVEPFRGDLDLDVARRALVMASPLDRRAGERVRFPHRFIQEFLVAEEALAHLHAGTLTIRDVDGLLTDEVAAFMALLRTQSGDVEMARRELLRYSGTLSWRTVDALFLDDRVMASLQLPTAARRRRARQDPSMSPWSMLSSSLWRAYKEPNYSLHVKDIVEQGLRVDDESGLYGLLCLFAIMLLAGANGSPNHPQAGPDSEAYDAMLELLLTRRGPVERFTPKQLQRRSERSDWKRLNDRDSRPMRARSGHHEGPHHKVWYDYTAIGDATILVPLTNTFVGDGRQGQRQIGRYRGEARVFRRPNGDLAIEVKGNERVEVRWIPSLVRELAQSLSAASGAQPVNLRAARPVFARYLPELAFVTDWLTDGTLRNDLRLAERVLLNQHIIATLGEMKSAWDRYEATLSDESPAEAPPWTPTTLQ